MKKIFAILITSILLFSCSEDVLDRTIFIPDEENPKLPAYSEWGYNSFGAKYERDYFLSSQRIIPCKILYVDNQLQFLLSGTTLDDKEMSLIFTFPSESISEYGDLLWLHDTKIDLSRSDCTVKIVQNKVESTLEILEGELYFKRAQLLNIEDQLNRIILSGVFDLRFLETGFPSTISNGRFDLGITENVFYTY